MQEVHLNLLHWKLHYILNVEFSYVSCLYILVYILNLLNENFDSVKKWSVQIFLHVGYIKMSSKLNQNKQFRKMEDASSHKRLMLNHKNKEIKKSDIHTIGSCSFFLGFGILENWSSEKERSTCYEVINATLIRNRRFWLG